MNSSLTAAAIIERLNRLLNDSMQSEEDRLNLTREVISIFHQLPSVQSYFEKMDKGEIKEDVNLEFLLLMLRELGFKRINNRIRPRTRNFLKYLDQQKTPKGRIKI